MADFATALQRQFSTKNTAGFPAVNQYYLFLTEGHAVGALINSRICFMSAHKNTLQRAVVGLIAVMCALMDSTFDALVCIAVHNLFLLFL